MKKKGYSYLDYYGLSQYRDVVEEAKEKLREQIKQIKIEESRRLLGGMKEYISPTKNKVFYLSMYLYYNNIL